jgi:Abnormal spindle-like microcephaly-assoc'd, ASPM-SPD-2-Hydin
MVSRTRSQFSYLLGSKGYFLGTRCLLICTSCVTVSAAFDRKVLRKNPLLGEVMMIDQLASQSYKQSPVLIMARALSLLATGIIAGCGGGGSSPAPSSGPIAAIPGVLLSPASLTFPAQPVGVHSASQTVTLTNNGSAVLTISGIILAGTDVTAFTETNTCGTSLAPTMSCTVSVVFDATSIGPLSGMLNVTDNASGSPQAVTLMGTGVAAGVTAVDCSVAAGLCSTLVFQSDPIADGLFHGYADPAMRKDPNSSTLYVAYSWPHTLADGTRTVDLHLSHSNDGGTTFVYDGSLYATGNSTLQYNGNSYYTSTETIDLLPIPQGNKTLWVQAHQQYLVAPQTAIYGNLYTTNITSMTAILIDPASTTPAMLAAQLSAAPEARLGTSSSDAARGITQNLAALSATTAKCSAFGQQALTFAAGTLYLALECTETPGNGNIDGHEGSHFLYSTMPVGADASQWVWSYVGEFATPVQAAQLGGVEGTAYNFFTEMQFVQTTSGLSVVITPAVFAPSTATQPVIQYGCRVIPVASLLVPALKLDTVTSAPLVIAKVTESDLYTGSNEGPAACTYDPASATGILLGRKYERDPSLGFIVTQLASGIQP